MRKRGKSYTQREFEHAVACDVPTLVFYHENYNTLAGDRLEPTDEGKRKFAEFLELAKKDRLCKSWKTTEQLPSVVIPSILFMALSCNRPGWRYRGEKTKEFLELELENSKLQNQVTLLEARNRNAPTANFLDYDDAVATIDQGLSSSATFCERSRKPLKIRALGICLYKTFPTLKKFIESRFPDVRVEIRLAVLDERSPEFAALDHRWKSLCDVFHDDLAQLLGFLRRPGNTKNVSLKLSKYHHMPNWHGLLINEDHLFLGHCLWHEDGTLTAGQNPYDYYRQGQSQVHERKIKQYTKWFDYCRRCDSRPKTEQLLIDTHPVI